MPETLVKRFHWCDFAGQDDPALAAAEKYQGLVTWAGKARGTNPHAFDALTEWVRDDGQWGKDQLAANEQLLMGGVLARFRAQNKQLRACLQELEPAGVVNAAVFKALDRFDDELAGVAHAPHLREAVAKVFADFTAMCERSTRELIGGNKTGPAGVNYVDVFGYLNYLKDCDAAVQWALFMPEVVARQQKGFQLVNFAYIRQPALRFIGKETGKGGSEDVRREVFDALEALNEYRTEYSQDLLFMHHYGLTVDMGPSYGFWGRFFQAGTPVPEGMEHFDLLPEHNGKAGPPFLSQFAFATFAGDCTAMHTHEGYDVNGLYDVTRNIMLGQGVNIPYPDKYWTAELFQDGWEKPGTCYLFSAEL